jgi:hypothetical protein
MESCAFMCGTNRLALCRTGDFNRTSSSEMDRLVGAETFRNFGAWTKSDFWVVLDKVGIFLLHISWEAYEFYDPSPCSCCTVLVDDDTH